MKTELFNEILNKVAEETELDKESILHSNKEECTDARYILIQSLIRLGFTDTDMAALMGKSRQTICYMRNSYKKVGKWTLENDLQSIRKWVENKYLSSK